MPRTPSDAHKKSSGSSTSAIEEAALESGDAPDAAVATTTSSSSCAAARGVWVWLKKAPTRGKDRIRTFLRTTVSQNRRRYVTEEFDLDLTYITDRIIAMGYPSETSESLYRNSMTDTQTFLDKYHWDHYKVFNLRGLYVYDVEKFHRRVVSFEMTDHHPPRLELMAPFCRMVHTYLEEDPHNIVAVHCKAGKGRTGVMICAYLCYVKFYPSPRQNMDYYSIIRTKNNKGVTIPSQRRYVYYFSHLRDHGLNYLPNRVELVGVYVERPPKPSGVLSSKRGFALKVAVGDVDVFIGEDMWMGSDDWQSEDEAWSGNATSLGSDSYNFYDPVQGKDVISRRAWGWTVPENKRVFLEGDIRVDVYNIRKQLGLKRDREKLGHLWFNTMFICTGYCGSVYRHGDEAHPYPEGETTICERRTLRPKTGSTSLPNSPPVADATARNSEPHIDRNTEERLSGGRKLEKKGKDKPLVVPRTKWDDEMELLLPPGLDRHCNEENLRLIYGDDIIPPRHQIQEMLCHAHRENLIEDNYNHRRLSVPLEGTPVAAASEGRPAASGPNLIRRAVDEHAQCYPVMEVDRACKNKAVPDGFKVYIVTRCIRPDDAEANGLARSFMGYTYEKQAEKDEKKRLKKLARAKGQGNTSANKNAVILDGTEDAEGEEHPDPRARDPQMQKFFCKQRCDSVSAHPPETVKCPLHQLPMTTGTLRNERAHPKEHKSGFAGDAVSDYDGEVRSYHPEADPDVNNSSRSSSSSDDCLPGPSTA